MINPIATYTLVYNLYMVPGCRDGKLGLGFLMNKESSPSMWSSTHCTIVITLFKNKLNRLKQLMKEHYLHIAPENIALRAQPKRSCLVLTQKNNCKLQVHNSSYTSPVLILFSGPTMIQYSTNSTLQSSPQKRGSHTSTFVLCKSSYQ